MKNRAFRLEETKTITFYQIPKILFTNPYYRKTKYIKTVVSNGTAIEFEITFKEYKKENDFLKTLDKEEKKEIGYKVEAISLSDSAKLAYSILRDRLDLSRKNGWVDKEGYVYIKFGREALANILNCTKKSAINYMGQLKHFGLIYEEKIITKKGQQAPLIYVNKPETSEDIIDDLNNIVNKNKEKTQKNIVRDYKVEGCNFYTAGGEKNTLSGGVNITPAGGKLLHPNHTDIINTYFSDNKSFNHSNNENKKESKKNYRERKKDIKNTLDFDDNFYLETLDQLKLDKHFNIHQIEQIQTAIQHLLLGKTKWPISIVKAKLSYLCKLEDNEALFFLESALKATCSENVQVAPISYLASCIINCGVQAKIKLESFFNNQNIENYNYNTGQN